MSLSLFTPLLCSPAAQADNYPGGYPGGGSGSGGSGGSGGGYPGGSGGSGYPGSAGWVAQPAVVNGVTYPAAVSGTVTVTFTDAQGHTTSGTGDYHNDGSSPPPLSVNAGESLTYKVNGKVVYTWKWNGGPNNLPPPPTQCVLETATAGAYGGGDANGTVNVTASDGGIGTENKVDSVSDDGKTQTHSDGFGGAQLVTMDGSSGTLTVTGTVQAECDLSEPKSGGGYPGGGYPGGGYPGSGGSGSLHGNAGCYFTAALDTRAVTISSSLGQTYHKGPQSDGHGVALPEADTPLWNGGGFATTVVPNEETPYVADNYWTYVIDFHANPAGSWSADSPYHWQVSLGNTSGMQHPLDGTFDLPYDPPYDIDPEYITMGQAFGNVAPGMTESISIMLKDATDGATASNWYNITFHAPTENWHLWDKGNPFWQGATTDNVASPGFALHNSGITATWEYTDTFWAQAATAFTSVGGNMVPNAYWAGLCAAASIAFSQTQPKTLQQTVNFNDAWTDSNATFNPKPADSTPATMELYKMVPELYIQYQEQTWRGDAYAASGYTGGVQTAIDKYLRADTAGDFTLAASDPTGGH